VAEVEKRPYAFRLRTKEPFAICALWEQPKDNPDGAFVLLTVAANAVVEPVQHRMAMMLNRQHWNQWMDPSVPTDQITGMITPSAAEVWDAKPVSKRVNKVRNNDAGLQTLTHQPEHMGAALAAISADRRKRPLIPRPT